MIVFFMVALGAWITNYGHCDVYYYYYYYHNMRITLLKKGGGMGGGGLGISYEKGLGLGVASPPNNTLVNLIYVIFYHGGPKNHN